MKNCRNVKSNDYTKENLLDYLHHQKWKKLIRIYLSSHTNMNIPQQINSVGRLDENIVSKHFKLFFRFIKHAPFTKCITKIDGTTTDNLDLVTLIYHWIEYSLKWSDMTGSLWFFSKDEATNFKLLRILMILNAHSQVWDNFWQLKVL